MSTALDCSQLRQTVVNCIRLWATASEYNWNKFHFFVIQNNEFCATNRRNMFQFQTVFFLRALACLSQQSKVGTTALMAGLRASSWTDTMTSAERTINLPVAGTPLQQQTIYDIFHINLFDYSVFFPEKTPKKVKHWISCYWLRWTYRCFTV